LNNLAPVTKAELEGKHLAELHTLAAEAGVARYRMLTRDELIEALAGGEAPARSRTAEAPQRRRRPRERRPREQRREEAARPEREAARPGPGPPQPEAEVARPRRRRRRRRFRRRKSLRPHELLLPAAPGRQTIVYAETQGACTALLRNLAAELADASKGPEPIAVLVDPSPEELADWRREAPGAEIVAAGKAQHVDDALAQAARRAEQGENVIVLIDSLSRVVEEYGDADGAKEFFDAGLEAGRRAGGSLSVVAGLLRS
jgi:Rho termination factor, N-terminal domain